MSPQDGEAALLAATQGLTEAVTSALGTVTDVKSQPGDVTEEFPMPPPPRECSPPGLPLPPSPLPPTPPLPSSLPPPRRSIDLPSPPLMITQVEWKHKAAISKPLFALTNVKSGRPHPSSPSTASSHHCWGTGATWHPREKSGDPVQEENKVYLINKRIVNIIWSNNKSKLVIQGSTIPSSYPILSVHFLKHDDGQCQDGSPIPSNPTKTITSKSASASSAMFVQRTGELFYISSVV